MFTFAHLSDVHLAPLPEPEFSELLSKRLIGLASWKWRRRNIHLRDIADAMVEDIKSAKPDHVALTGDLVNIATKLEFKQGQRWLEQFAEPDWLTFVPGNHDAYVSVPWSDGLGLWANYMTSDLRVDNQRQTQELAAPFPFVRLRRNVAMIGVSSAHPASLHQATGRVGERQMQALEEILKSLRERGFYRIVLIHHPPLPGMAIARKGLLDAEEFETVLEKCGAELVLHGHNHLHMRKTFNTSTGPAHILGVPSASACKGDHRPAAAWYHHHVRRQAGEWQDSISVRTWDADANTFMTETEFTLVSSNG